MPVGALVLGYTIALVFALPPSVILTETIRRGARGGFWPAVAVQYGSIVADCLYALVGLTGAAILVTNPVVQVLLGGLGIVFMAFLGVTGLRAALTDAGPALIDGTDTGPALAPPGAPRDADASIPGAGAGRLRAALASRGPFLAGVALGLANPWAVAFWLGVGGTFAAAGLGGATAVDYAAFFLAYLAGLSTYSITVAAIVGIGHRRLERRWLRVAEGAAAVALLVFAAVFTVRVADLAISLAG
jgi:chemosensory pili system protein ChpE